MPWPAMEEVPASASDNSAINAVGSDSSVVFKPIENFEIVEPSMVAVEVKPEKSENTQSI